MQITISQPYSFLQLGQRSNQEDARYPDTDSPEGFKPAFLVCDGVGGQDKGEVASRIVADSIGVSLQKVDLTKPFTVRDFEPILDRAYEALIAGAKKGNEDMATTMTLVCFHGGGVFAAHIGDSRIYQIRPGDGILYKSDDHSLVNALVHSGNITPDEAINHPQSNVITRCMSPSPKFRESPASTFQIKDVAAGDYFFLCSDGVEHCVDDDLLEEILSSPSSDEWKIGKLAELSRGSSDNNTAYLIRVESVDGITLPDIDIETDEEHFGGSNTREIAVAHEVVLETKPGQHRKSVGEKISDFFNKLF